MPLHLCQGCDRFHNGPGTRCPTCTKTNDQKRGTRQQRGYNRAHELERQRQLDAWQDGQPCAICHKPTRDNTRLDLAHNADRTGYLGLAHDTCNRRTNT